MRLLPFTLVIATALPACTWVKMEPGASAVRVARLSDDVSACSKRGEVGVTVKDKVGLYQRNELKVRDELETMARNEARSLGADTVQALDEPSAGEQRFAVYTCGMRAPVTRAASESSREAGVAPVSDAAQTYPMKDD